MAKIAIYNITNTLKRGGVETCLWEMAKKFDQWGHDVTVFGGRGPVRPEGDIQRIKVVTFDYASRDQIVNLGSRFKKLGERLSFALNAWPTLRDGAFDGIVLGKPYDIPVGLLARKKKGTRVAYSSGGGEYFPGYASLVKRLDYFCGCSAFDCDEIFKYCGVRPAPNNYGVDTEVFRPLPPDAEFAGKWGVEPGKDRVIATAVRLVAFKGIDVGLKAIAALRESHPTIKYLVAGEGPEKNKLVELVRTLDLGRHVVFCGELSHGNLPRFYSLAEAAIFPSLMETYGVAVGEAMACGKPVIASNVGGIPEQVAPGTGVLFPAKDQAALAGAMAGVLGDADRLEMGKRARDHAVKNLDWNLCAKRLFDGLFRAKS